MRRLIQVVLPEFESELETLPKQERHARAEKAEAEPQLREEPVKLDGTNTRLEWLPYRTRGSRAEAVGDKGDGSSLRFSFAPSRNAHGEIKCQDMQCGIIEAAHIEDAIGYPCGNDSVAKCLDCGIPVCDAHAESCGPCEETFCATCLAFHNREQHQKKPGAVQERRRKSA